MDAESLMTLAIEKARAGVEAGQSPFGCAIHVEDQLIAAHNTVLRDTDITAHAEINAIREGCRRIGDIFIVDGVAASTCEPCPMCMSALHWTRIETVYFGANIDDAKQAGFNELQLPSRQIVTMGGSQVKLVPGVLADQCRQLFSDWLARPDRQAY